MLFSLVFKCLCFSLSLQECIDLYAAELPPFLCQGDSSSTLFHGEIDIDSNKRFERILRKTIAKSLLRVFISEEGFWTYVLAKSFQRIIWYASN